MGPRVKIPDLKARLNYDHREMTLYLKDNSLLIEFVVGFVFGVVVVVIVCLPRPMEGMGLLKFSDLFTELPPADGDVGTFNCAFLYIILSTTVSFVDLMDAILFLQGLLFFIFFVYIQPVGCGCSCSWSWVWSWVWSWGWSLLLGFEVGICCLGLGFSLSYFSMYLGYKLFTK